jgi:hypothetical protein
LSTDTGAAFGDETNGLITPSTTVRAQVCLVDEGEPDGGVGETLERAAALLQESIDADGVLILDASVHSYGGAVTGQQCFSDSEPDTAISSSTSDDYGSDDDTFVDCRVLARSKRSTSETEESPAISEKILRSLLRHYPAGHVWSFGSDGQFPNSDNYSTDEAKPQIERRESRRKKSRKAREAREIQRVFPGARTVCLVSMWDNVRERFYAGGFIWTYSPIRQFSSELSYMMAFMDVVMAKVSRIEANVKDQAKSDFISSVSHELRSPLHGERTTNLESRSMANASYHCRHSWKH